MPSSQRYVVVGIFALAVVVAMALSQGLQWLWVQVGWNDPFLFSIRELPFTAVLAYGTCLGAGVVLLKHAHTHQLATEIVEELGRVTWPSRAETGSATLVVVVTLLICGAFLGIFDALWLWLTNWLLGT